MTARPEVATTPDVAAVIAEAQRDTPARRHLAHLVNLGVQAFQQTLAEQKERAPFSVWDETFRDALRDHLHERLAQGVMAREIELEREHAEELSDMEHDATRIGARRALLAVLPTHEQAIDALVDVALADS